MFHVEQKNIFYRSQTMKIDAKIKYLETRDFSVTQEEFTLYLDNSMEMLVTKPVPDLTSISKYYESENYISHTDGKRGLIEKLYQLVKKRTLKQKVSLLSKYHSSKGKLLDIGCGTGDFLAVAKRKQWTALGIEPNEKAGRFAKEKGLTLQNNIDEVKSDSIDVVTMWHVLEHIPDWEHQIKEIQRVLKKEGILMIAVPNFKSFDAAYYQQYWAAYDVPRHLWHFSQTSIQHIVNSFDFQLLGIRPMWMDSFYVSLLSEKYKTGKYNYIKAFWIGLRSNLKARKSKEYSSLLYVIQNKKGF